MLTEDHPAEPEEEISAEDLAALQSAAPKLKSQILTNIVNKIGNGGVPTAREQEMLNKAVNGAGPGRPSKAIRWTVDHAATEFGRDRKTIARKLREASIPEGQDGKFSTLDLCQALFESANARDEKDTQQAENFRLKNEELRRQRIPKEDVLALWDGYLQSLAVQIKSAKGQTLTEELINALFAEIRKAPALPGNPAQPDAC